MKEVVVIDDGINEEYVGISQLHYNLEIDSKLNVRQRIKYDGKAKSHGSMCAAIIKKYEPNTYFSSIKILNEATYKGNIQQLELALKICSKIDIKIISISLGTTNLFDGKEIAKVIGELVRKNKIIVAAYSNSTKISFPAAFTGVIGVKASRKLRSNEIIVCSELCKNYDFMAAGYQKINIKGNTELIGYGNSFAVPVVTAKVLEIYEDGMLLINIVDRLINKKEKKRGVLYNKLSMFDIYDRYILIGNFPDYVYRSKSFEIENHYSENDLINRRVELNENVSLIVLPSDNVNYMNAIKSIIKEKKIRKIIYLGKREINLYDELQSAGILFYWDTTMCTIHKSRGCNRILQFNIYNLRGNELQLIPLVSNIIEKLHEKGFNAILISSNIFCCLFGGMFIEREENLGYLLNILEKKMQLDFVFVINSGLEQYGINFDFTNKKTFMLKYFLLWCYINKIE